MHVYVSVCVSVVSSIPLFHAYAENTLRLHLFSVLGMCFELLVNEGEKKIHLFQNKSIKLFIKCRR